MTRVAFYAGSFDPPTNGHFDVIARAPALCDRL
ncbi:MAG: adenylyltransferase/cytidyltransferase family protein, partial [Hyphomicrobiales bacterium]|nr:adenylyltransferase/cytidyltransferase family protein [Hyphomicrobiales bacterium]